jgi:L-rhamnose mutarotase
MEGTTMAERLHQVIEDLMDQHSLFHIFWAIEDVVAGKARCEDQPLAQRWKKALDSIEATVDRVGQLGL